jgi:hypothetical protein
MVSVLPSAAADEMNAATQHFETRVRPLLIDRCVKCHGPEKQKGGLRLDLRSAMLIGGESGAALSPDNPDGSLLWRRIVSREMPPQGEPPLTNAHIVDIRKWLSSSAPMEDRPETLQSISPQAWREHWAFQKPDQERALRSLPADVRTGSANLIDAFVQTAISDRGLMRAPKASRLTLIRRACFDLLGLPPSPEQIDRFISDDSANAWPTLINELLASPHYGERWGRHWLDVARYADSGGYETDMYYRHAWRYRDYVIKSFNDDKPYDRFVQEQIAGDELWPDSLELDGNYVLADSRKKALEAHIGTGFYALGPQIHESSMDARKQDYERLTDWADATGAAFLGITLGCARCHDHKFDPFTQRDYFALQAVFSRSREIERPIVNAMEIADFKQHYPWILAVRAARERYRQFEQSIAGRTATAEEEAKRHQLLEAIGTAVLNVPERATSTPNSAFDGILEVPAVSVLGHERPELVRPTQVLARGDLDRPQSAVGPGLPVALAELTGVEPALPDGLSSRKELALWITRPDHPLTSRVIVNRIWQWHFGRGLVSTASDFGNMGQPPSHPELLDWIASEFVERGWSIKELHRLIMTSETYQQASDVAPEPNSTLDPDNRLLWRFNRRRLEGEAIWDSLHAASGTLNLQLGGPPVIPPLSGEELSALRDRNRWVVTPDPRQHSRRGLYIVNYRNFRFPLFEVFDAPGSSVSSPGRDVSTVAPQSLWLLNNQTAWQQAEHLAARCVREAGDKPHAVITRLWRLALGRPPSDSELNEAAALYEQLALSESGASSETAAAELKSLPQPRAMALVNLCLAMFNHNEFLFID